VLFAEDFDAPEGDAPIPEPEVIEPAFSPADLESARAEAWQAGHDAGIAEVATDHATAIREALQAIAERMADARAQTAALAEQAADALAALLLDSLGAIMPALAAQYGKTELLHVVRELLPALSAEPAVSIRLHASHAAAVQAEIERFDPELAARVQIIASNTAEPGDIRVTWRNGQAERNTAELWGRVAAILMPAGLLPHDSTREIERVE
jgi:flagellar biosynthesis/type III secretory pathway protein FliH